MIDTVITLCFPNINNAYVFIFYLRQAEFFEKGSGLRKGSEGKGTIIVLNHSSFLLHLPLSQHAVYLRKVPSVSTSPLCYFIQEAILIRKGKRQRDFFVI